MCGGHAPPAGTRARRQADSHGQARGAARGAADERDDHRRDVCEVDPVVARPADADQPVGQRRSLGDAAAAVPANGGVSLAGGAHGPRHERGGGRRDAADARGVCHVRRAGSRDARGEGAEAGGGAVSWGGRHLLDRGDDAGWQGAAGRHLPLSRPKLRQGAEHQVCQHQRRGGVLLDDLVGRVYSADRRRDHDACR